MRKTGVVLILVLSTALCGCVERKLTVTSTPPGAKVYLDDEPKGETPVTFRFNFHGHRTFKLKKDGYRVCEEVKWVRPPFWEYPVLDAIADLTPIPLEDHKKFHFELEPVREVVTEDVLYRARALKARMEGKPAPEKPAPAKTEPAGTPTEAQPTPVEAVPTPAEPMPPAETRSEETPESPEAPDKPDDTEPDPEM
ncbi:MAG TPA: PEGA domain-containing protein [Planctomycetota bacterium]|nr:PEGA domain-containing protein [Planctomycetota bacterium]